MGQSGAEELVQHLRALASLTEDLSSTYIKHLTTAGNFNSREPDVPYWPHTSNCTCVYKQADRHIDIIFKIVIK